MVSNSVSKQYFIAFFLGLLVAPAVADWVIQEADSEMEFSVQDAYWGVSLVLTTVEGREGGRS